MGPNRNHAAVVALSLVAAVLAALLLPGAGALHAVLFAVLVAALWASGTPRRRGDRLLGAALFASLLLGGLFAALSPETGFLGLLLGVSAVPLLVTATGFALAFEPVDPEVLKKLREGRE